MSKEALAELIDAYADAKATNNKVLIQTMIRQLEVTLDALFPEASKEEGTPSVEITEEGTY